MFLISLLVACGDKVTTIELTDANNYTLGGSVDLPSYPTVSGANVSFDWATLVQDIQCHDVDPSVDIDNAALVRFSLTEAEVEEGLARNSLKQSDNTGYLEVHTEGATSAELVDMTLFGTPVDITQEYAEGLGTYMLILTTGTDPGVGARTLAFLAPSASSDVTSVTLGDACGMLDLQVDFSGLTAVSVPEGEGEGWEVDWSALTTDGQGNAFPATGVDRLDIGYYESLTIDDIEANFLDVEQLATKMYSLALTGGTTASLDGAKAGTEAFTGFSGEGLWLLALRCSRCYNPAPLFFTVLDPTGA